MFFLHDPIIFEREAMPFPCNGFLVVMGNGLIVARNEQTSTKVLRISKFHMSGSSEPIWMQISAN